MPFLVLPAFPFSLFDFKYIEKFGPIHHNTKAAAGVAIPETTLYTCPEHRFALILGACARSIKTTATSFSMYIVHAERQGADMQEYLMHETIGSGTYPLSFPNSKESTEWGIGWRLLFLFPKDEIRIAQSLTAAETIEVETIIDLIQYKDPRYEVEP